MRAQALASGYPGLKRLVKATAGLATYIANNTAAIVTYSERWHNGERISTAFVESTVNRVVSRRFAKKQQMQWSKKGEVDPGNETGGDARVLLL
jgi:hypothetical protein